MKTKLISVNPAQVEQGALNEAIKLLQQGEVVGFPTETVYGLGASAFSETAIQKIFDAKGRPQDNPLIVHVSSMEMLKECVLEIPKIVYTLSKKFWPGPLTILFKKSSKIPDRVTAGLDTVAIRMPSNYIAAQLIELSGLPLAAPSANLSGKPSPTKAIHVYHDLNGKIPLILDGGSCEFGVESTVIDIFRDPPMILRPGGLNYEALREVIPNIQVYEKTKTDKELEQRPSTPGLKYRHYSPKAKVILLECPENQMLSKLSVIVSELQAKLQKIGIIHTHLGLNIPSTIQNAQNIIVKPLGSKKTKFSPNDNSKAVAAGIFAMLRVLDDSNVDYIIVEGISDNFEGLAVMNRLRKAASEIIK